MKSTTAREAFGQDQVFTCNTHTHTHTHTHMHTLSHPPIHTHPSHPPTPPSHPTHTHQLVETMPQTKEVQDFLKVIGPFYEIVEDEEDEEEEERKGGEERANQSELAGMSNIWL